MSEYDEAIALANRVLERPSADPDDDLALLARQFLRATEARDFYRDERDRLRKAVSSYLASLRAGMTFLVNGSARSLGFRAAADQTAAALEELKAAVEGAI